MPWRRVDVIDNFPLQFFRQLGKSKDGHCCWYFLSLSEELFSLYRNHKKNKGVCKCSLSFSTFILLYHGHLLKGKTTTGFLTIRRSVKQWTIQSVVVRPARGWTDLSWSRRSYAPRSVYSCPGEWRSNYAYTLRLAVRRMRSGDCRIRGGRFRPVTLNSTQEESISRRLRSIRRAFSLSLVVK